MQWYLLRQLKAGAVGLCALLHSLLTLMLVCALSSTVGLVWMQFYGHAVLVAVVVGGLYLLSRYLLIELWRTHAE